MTETIPEAQPKHPERLEHPPLLPCISQILDEILAETDKLDAQQTAFTATKIPSITLRNYLQRISKYARCSDECFVLALIYLDRLQDLNQGLLLNSHCVHRFLITAVLIAIKYQDDDYYRNEYYAKIGGISTRELNELEREFLHLIRYNAYVSEALFRTYLDKLEQYLNN